MHIFIDGRTIKHNPSGLGLWNLRLVQNLLKKDSIKKIDLLIPSNYNYLFDQDVELAPHIGKKLNLLPFSPPYRFVSGDRFIFEQFKLGHMIENAGPDMYHATDSFGVPFFLNKKIKTMLTVHDLIPLTPFREYMDNFKFMLYKMSLSIAKKTSDMIVAISDKTKDDIASFMKVPLSEIEVIYDGVDKPDVHGDPQAWKAFAATQGLENNKYILYYGGFGKRRNVPHLLHVFHQLIEKKIITADTKLVLSGRITNAKTEAVDNVAKLRKIIDTLGLQNNVLFLDYLEHGVKIELVKNCLLFIALSCYEGFGLGPIEVMQQGKHAVFTRVGIWPSYVKENTFIVNDITSVDETVSKVKTVLKNDAHVKADFDDLKSFIKQFSWEKMADEYEQLYLRLLSK